MLYSNTVQVDNHYQDSSTQHQDYTIAATREFDGGQTKLLFVCSAFNQIISGAVEELRKAGVTVKVKWV